MSSDPQVAGLLNTDTDLEAERQQIRRWRAMSGLDKLRAVAEMNAAVDTMALAGIRVRHPAASPREQFLRLELMRSQISGMQSVIERMKSWWKSNF